MHQRRLGTFMCDLMHNYDMTLANVMFDRGQEHTKKQLQEDLPIELSKLIKAK